MLVFLDLCGFPRENEGFLRACFCKNQVQQTPQMVAKCVSNDVFSRSLNLTFCSCFTVRWTCLSGLFWTCFDDGFGWASISEILGQGDPNPRTVWLKTQLTQTLEQCGLRRNRPSPLEQWGLRRNRPQPPRTVGLKIHNHVPHPSNDQKMSLTTCFGRVLTMVLDGFQFREFWGRVNQAGCEQCASSAA